MNFTKAIAAEDSILAAVKAEVEKRWRKLPTNASKYKQIGTQGDSPWWNKQTYNKQT